MTNNNWKHLLSHINDVINDGNRLLGEEEYIEIPEMFFRIVEPTVEGKETKKQQKFREDSGDMAGIEIHLMSNSSRMIFRLLKDGQWRVTTSAQGKYSNFSGLSKFLYHEKYKQINELQT